MLWEEIRNEYITTDIGLRPLAAKHDVSFNTMKRRAKCEQWSQLRASYRIEMGAEAVRLSMPKARDEPQPAEPQPTEETTAPAVKTEQAQNARGVFATAEKLLCAIELVADMGVLKPADIRALTGALKDIKEIQMIQDVLTPKITMIIEEERSGRGHNDTDTRAEL